MKQILQEPPTLLPSASNSSNRLANSSHSPEPLRQIELETQENLNFDARQKLVALTLCV